MWVGGASLDVFIQVLSCENTHVLNFPQSLRALCSGQVSVLAATTCKVYIHLLLADGNFWFSAVRWAGAFALGVRMRCGHAALLRLQPTHRCNSVEELSAQPTHAQSRLSIDSCMPTHFITSLVSMVTSTIHPDHYPYAGVDYSDYSVGTSRG